jgi:hypothetical protein
MKLSVKLIFLLLTCIVVLSNALYAHPSDSLRTKKKHKLTDTVGIVNGTPIFYGDFKAILKGVIRDNQKDSVVSDTAFTRYVDLAWEKIIRDVIVEEEIGKRKLGLKDEQVIRKLLAEPAPELKKEFKKTDGSFDSAACGKYFRDPNPDLVRTQYLEYWRTRLEEDRLRLAIAPKARNPEEREQAFRQWYVKVRTKAQIIDGRTAFGLY